MTPQQKIGIFGIFMCAVLAFMIIQFDVRLVFGAVLLIGLLVLGVALPEMGTLTVMFVLYTNLAGIANNSYGVPDSIATSFSLLLGLPLVSYIIIQRQKLIVDSPVFLMLVFLGAILVSSLVAVDLPRALQWISEYLVEGLALYLLIINVVRRSATLRRVIWTLIVAGSLLGALTLYQEVTNSYDKDFGGLVARNSLQESGVVTEDENIQLNRAGGPIDGNPNRFAQILIALFPLALFRIWGERSLWLRAFAMIASIFILSGILLTYSRAAFVTLVLLLLIMTFLRYIRPHQILIGLAGLILLITLAAPGYLSRINSLQGVQAVISQDSGQKADASTRSRVTEMLAALNVFLDHPILGVGPGQYTQYYSIDYQLDPDIALRYIPKSRRAHMLYFELAAETGAIGLASFMAIVLLIIYRLWQTRRRWIQDRPDFANVATALLLSIIAYLGTSLFASLAYQRYYWLILALASAAVQIFDVEFQKRQRPVGTIGERPKILNQTASQV